MDEKLVILLRHGQTDKNVLNLLTSSIDGWPLNSNGVAMAREAAKRLSVLPKIDSLYTSPVLRAVETAGFISRQFGVSTIVDSRLRERWFGIFEGREEPDDPVWKLKTENRVEPWSAMRSKMQSFIDDSSGGIIVGVTHGDNMTAASDLYDDRGEVFHGSCPGLCHFTVIDARRGRIIAEDVDSIPEEAIRCP